MAERARKIMAEPVETNTEDTRIERWLTRVSHLDSRLTHVEQAYNRLSNHMDSKFEELSKQIGEMSKNMSIAAAQPRWQLGEVLGTVQSVAVLIGAAAGAIIWIATSISSAPLASVHKQIEANNARLERLEAAYERYALRHFNK